MKVDVKTLPLSELESSSIFSLLRYLKIRSGMIAVPKKRIILKRAVWSETLWNDKDQSEILRFVGEG